MANLEPQLETDEPLMEEVSTTDNDAMPGDHC